VPLVDTATELNPLGEFTIGEIVAMCLSKTGLALPIRVACNIKNAGFTDDISVPNTNDQHFFSLNYLHAKTWEDTPGVSIDCYSVLQKLFYPGVFIFQRHGYWWLVRRNEIELGHDLYVTEFDSAGRFLENLGALSFDNSIGKDDPFTICFSGAATEVTQERGINILEIEGPYDYPRELPTNNDFERGVASPADDGTFDEDGDGTPEAYQAFVPDNWIMIEGGPFNYSAPSSRALVRKFFVDDHEKKRFLVITPRSVFENNSVSDINYLRSDPMPMHRMDKFTAGIDVRLETNFSGATTRKLMRFVLHGTDGSIWILGWEDFFNDQSRPKWYDTSLWTVNTAAGERVFSSGTLVETEWNNYENIAPPLPVDGDLYVWLHNFRQTNAAGDNISIFYSSLQFEYIPYINGSYRKYSAQQQKITNAVANYKERRQLTTNVSNFPKFLIKGTLITPLGFNLIVADVPAEFVNGSSFTLSGFMLPYFRPGMRISITGTSLNNHVLTRVLGASYDSGPDETTVTIDTGTFLESAAETTLQYLTFQLAENYYDAALYPAGPPTDEDEKPHSALQIFDVWNRLKTEMKVLQAQMHGIDASALDSELHPNLPAVVHRWTVADITPSTTGRVFELLTFRMDLRTCSWSGVLREADNSGRLKQYTGRVFKYLE
jgi:hypothetical protein